MVLEQRTRTDQGQFGEDAAVTHLVKEGHAILARNWRWKRAEIDIVSWDGFRIVFHEVKFRSGCVMSANDPRLWMPSTAQKKRIVQAGHVYLRHEVGRLVDCQFDVMLVSVLHQQVHITRIADAFSSSHGWGRVVG